MQAINAKATKILNSLTEGMKAGDHRSITNEPYTRLVIEVIGSIKTAGGHGQLISIAHYPEVEFGEDAITDPEVCLIKCVLPKIRKIKGIHQVVEETQYFPYYIKYNDGKEFTYVTFEEDGWHYYSYRFFSQKGLAEFVGIWANNIKEQGFLKAWEIQARNGWVANQINECAKLRQEA